MSWPTKHERMMKLAENGKTANGTALLPVADPIEPKTALMTPAQRKTAAQILRRK